MYLDSASTQSFTSNSNNIISTSQKSKMSENKRVVELKKGAWSQEEDQKLFAQISQFGTRNWTQIPKAAGLLRTGKSCRLRWLNYLRPGLKRGHFTPEENIIVMQAHELLGNKWSKIASLLPGRTDNEIKNYWHTYIRKSIAPYNDIDTSRSQQGRPKKLKQQQKQKRGIIPSPELASENSSTISMDTCIDFPIIESYSPNDNDYSSSSVSNTESINLSDEDGWSYQKIFAEPYSIEDEQLLVGMNNSSTMAFFDENITWASVLDHQLSSHLHIPLS